MLEAGQHGDNTFVTLTYSDDKLPASLSLDPKHPQDWLKRLRSEISPVKIRYYLVGEYGDETHRPHYHAALFGFPNCLRGNTDHRRQTANYCCDPCCIIRDTWGFGHISLGTLETHSAQYIAGYVTKKMTHKDDPRLGGRHPEFARMSLRPGIGADALHEVADTLMKFNLDTSQDDVPSALRHGSRNLPLGRYMRRRLRKLVGKEESAPESTIEQSQEEVQKLYEAARADLPHRGQEEARRYLFKALLEESDAQKVKNMEARQRIFKPKRNL